MRRRTFVLDAAGAVVARHRRRRRRRPRTPRTAMPDAPPNWRALADRTVGTAGLALGGGLGADARNAALTCDALVSAEVVLPIGDVVTASVDEHASAVHVHPDARSPRLRPLLRGRRRCAPAARLRPRFGCRGRTRWESRPADRRGRKGMGRWGWRDRGRRIPQRRSAGRRSRRNGVSVASARRVHPVVRRAHHTRGGRHGDPVAGGCPPVRAGEFGGRVRQLPRVRHPGGTVLRRESGTARSDPADMRPRSGDEHRSGALTGPPSTC